MNTVDLFQPGLLSVNIEIPGEWNELNQVELLHITKHLLQPYAEQEYFYGVIFFFLIQHRGNLQKVALPPNLAQIINVEDLAMQQTEALSWIHSNSSLTEQLIDHLSIPESRIPKFYGPLSAFNNLTCAEFEDCEVFSHLYKLENNPDHLGMIASILYRPHQDGRRLPYITTSWQSVSKKFRHLYKEEDDMIMYNPEITKPFFLNLGAHIILAVYLWYVGCRSELHLLFPHVFRDGGKGEPDLAAFTKCIHAGAGPKNGTRDKIRRSLLKAFLMDIEQDAIYAEELNKKSS